MPKSASEIQVWNRALTKIGETDPIEDETDDRLAAEQCKLHYDDCVLAVFESRPWPFATKQAALSRPSVVDNFTGDGSTTEYALTKGYRAATEVTVTVGGVATTGFTMANAGTLRGSITFDSAPASDAAIVVTYSQQVVGWEYAYTLPTDCAMPLALLDEDQRIAQFNGDDRIPFEVVEDQSGEWRILCCDYSSSEFEVLEYTALNEYIPGWPRDFVEAVAWRLGAELALGLKKDLQLHQTCMQWFYASVSSATASQQNSRHPDPEPDPPSVAIR